jgi:hypothetical protein
MTGAQNGNLESDVKDVSSIFDHYRMSARAIWNTAFWPDQDFRNWDSIDQFHKIEELLFQELALATRVECGCLTTKRLGRKEPSMLIMGVDYHPSFQQIAFLDQETGECGERRLNHSDQEAEKFYRDLRLRGVSVRVGLEATGYSRWFERLLASSRTGDENRRERNPNALRTRA